MWLQQNTMETKGKRSVFLSGENLREVPWGGHLGPQVAEKSRACAKALRLEGGWPQRGIGAGAVRLGSRRGVGSRQR